VPRREDAGKKREFITKIIIFQKIIPKITINNQKYQRKNHNVGDFSFERKPVSIENEVI